MVDRRGYGSRPDTERSDFAVDAADLLEVLDRTGSAHLVGHANGGLAAVLAAAELPDLVRSLALIQPPTFRAAIDEPAVRQLLERIEDTVIPEGTDPQDYLRGSTEGLGMAMPEPTPARLLAVATSMGERPVWEADIPVDALQEASRPTLVISGTWEDAPEPYRKYAVEALMACADSLTRTIGTQHLQVPGYYPHTQHPELVNAPSRTCGRGRPTQRPRRRATRCPGQDTEVVALAAD